MRYRSWVSDNLAARLGLRGNSLKLTVKDFYKEDLLTVEVLEKIYNEEVHLSVIPHKDQDFDIKLIKKVVQLTVIPHKNLDLEAFNVLHYMRETLNVGCDILDVKSMQETCPHLAEPDPVRCGYGNIETKLGKDAYNAINKLEYFSADEKCSPIDIHLPLLSNSSLVSACFEANFEQDFQIAFQVKSWYDMEKYGAYKQVDPRSAAESRAMEYLKQQLFITAYDTMLVWCGVDVNIQLPNNYFSSLMQFKPLEKLLSRDNSLTDN